MIEFVLGFIELSFIATFSAVCLYGCNIRGSIASINKKDKIAIWGMVAISLCALLVYMTSKEYVLCDGTNLLFSPLDSLITELFSGNDIIMKLVYFVIFMVPMVLLYGMSIKLIMENYLKIINKSYNYTFVALTAVAIYKDKWTLDHMALVLLIALLVYCVTAYIVYPFRKWKLSFVGVLIIALCLISFFEKAAVIRQVLLFYLQIIIISVVFAVVLKLIYKLRHTLRLILNIVCFVLIIIIQQGIA